MKRNRRKLPWDISFEIKHSIKIIFAITGILAAIILVIGKSTVVQPYPILIQMTILFLAPGYERCRMKIQSFSRAFFFKSCSKTFNLIIECSYFFSSGYIFIYFLLFLYKLLTLRPDGHIIVLL